VQAGRQDKLLFVHHVQIRCLVHSHTSIDVVVITSMYNPVCDAVHEQILHDVLISCSFEEWNNKIHMHLEPECT
jgi:hypothetical protein